MSAEDRNGEVSTDEKCSDCSTQERSFDELTKGLASATVSRRGALRLLAGTLFGGVLASVPGVGRVAGNSGEAQALVAPGDSTCANQGQSCTAQKCCEGLNCLADQTNSTEKFCCSPNSELVCGRSCCPTGALGNCSQGKCVCPTGEVVCPDANNPLAGKCVNLLEDPDNCGACGTVCQGPSGPDAPCRIRACVNGGCTTVPNPAVMPGVTPCEDGDLCTLGDTCNASGQCESGSRVSCPDCRMCDPDVGPPCVPDPAQVGQRCNDNDACTENDVCTGTALAPTGVCAGTPINCGDNNPCTVDGCDPATGCFHTNEPENTPCGTNQICCPPASGATAVCISNQTRSNCGTCGTQCQAGEDCCGGVCTALNTGTNCGACGVVCDTSNCMVCRADSTGQFRCVSACEPGQQCQNGTCVCNATSCPNGCCDTNNRCQTSTDAHCGTAGTPCQTCGPNTQCQNGTCTPVCNSTTCPTGCCQNGVCQAGTSPTACGTGGETCRTCSGMNNVCCAAPPFRGQCKRGSGAMCGGMGGSACCSGICLPNGRCA